MVITLGLNSAQLGTVIGKRDAIMKIATPVNPAFFSIFVVTVRAKVSTASISCGSVERRN